MKQINYLEDSVAEFKQPEFTTWVNPTTEYTAEFKVLTDKRIGLKKTGVKSVSVKLGPGEEIKLPKEWDTAIHITDSVGYVIGGLCPWLQKKDEEPTNIHPSVDSLRQIELDKELALAKEIEHDQFVEKAKLVLEEKKKRGRPAAK